MTLSATSTDPIILERDYIQHHIICALASLEDPRYTLKGGTLERVCCLLGHRFSDDLDFDGTGTRASFLVALGEALLRAEATSGIALRMEPRSAPHQVALIHWHDDPRRFIKVDLSLDPNDHLPTQMWPVLPNYDDLPPSPPIRGYTLESLACVKLACLAARRKPRDFYDFDRLIAAGVDLDAAWALHVTDVDIRRARGVSQVDPTKTRSSYQGRLPELTRRWEPFLAAGAIPGSPAFEPIYHAVDAAVVRCDARWREQLTPEELAYRGSLPKDPATESSAEHRAR